MTVMQGGASLAFSPSMTNLHIRGTGAVQYRRGTSVGAESQAKSDVSFHRESLDDIVRLRGPVATGYGRGGKKLGVPTANLPESLFKTALTTVPTGVYFGWAVIEGGTGNEDTIKGGRDVPHKAVVNVGYSPTFEGEENKEKIVEAHLITKSVDTILDDDGRTAFVAEEDIEGDFYGEVMRLQLIGFIRSEKKFDSFPELVAQIHNDVANAADALDGSPFSDFKGDTFLDSDCSWMGSGGGDESASWQFEDWDTAIGTN